MTNPEVGQLLATASQDREAAEQIAQWSSRLQAAIDARTRLSQLPPAELKQALEQR